MKNTSHGIEVIGFVETTDEFLYLNKIKTGKVERKLATDVLQFVFLGTTGFRFPIANYPTTSACELYVYTHEIIMKLSLYGFTVSAILMDGGINNREFIKCILTPVH